MCNQLIRRFSPDVFYSLYELISLMWKRRFFALPPCRSPHVHILTIISNRRKKTKRINYITDWFRRAHVQNVPALKIIVYHKFDWSGWNHLINRFILLLPKKFIDFVFLCKLLQFFEVLTLFFSVPVYLKSKHILFGLTWPKW